MRQTITVKESVLGKSGLRDLVISDAKFDERKLRPYQASIVNQHLTKLRTLTEAPTGSGKSTIMLCHAARSIADGKKVIITTPQLGINENFQRYTRCGRFQASIEGQKFQLPMGGIVEVSGKKSASIRRYLQGISTSVYVCSYPALILALEDESLGDALANTVVLVDEAHHSNYGNNSLGQLIDLCLEKCAEIHGFTATAFRTDNNMLFNGEFKRFRRTLKEHYNDPFDGASYCPDFGIYIRFYQDVPKDQFYKFAESRSLGSTKALIDAYLDEYEQHPLPTIMLVDTAAQAFKLQTEIKEKFPEKSILNLGSDDGQTLVSKQPRRLKKKFNRLSAGEKFDILIAIRLMNEGIDWPVCAQTFSPRISGSLQLLMQRAIGRTMRNKGEKEYPEHPSRNYSRIVLFEIGIENKDKDLCAKALFELAVRLKALCDGLDLGDNFKFCLSQKERTQVDHEKNKAKNESNPQLNNEILQQLCRLAARGVSAMGLAEKYAELCRDSGISIGPVNAMEVLIGCGVIDREFVGDLQTALSKKNAEKLNNRLTFAEFHGIFGDILDQIKVIGAADYTRLLSGHPDLDKVVRLLIDHTINSAEKNKEILLEMARRGERRPPCRPKKNLLNDHN